MNYSHLEMTCIGIPIESIFEMFYEIQLCSYIFNCESKVFDKPIGVMMQIYY